VAEIVDTPRWGKFDVRDRAYPRLCRMVPDIPNFDSRLLPHFSLHCVFECLTRLDKSGQRRVERLMELFLIASKGQSAKWIE
jgi:hypothetical protein